MLRPEPSPGDPTIAARLPALLPLPLLFLAGCLWLPDWPLPDTVVPDQALDEDDSNLVTHCTPHEGPSNPVLLRRGVAPVPFTCRIRGAESVQWTIDTRSGGPSVAPFVLAVGVEEVLVHGEDMPWSPAPYAAELSVVVQRGGRQTTISRPVIVSSDADEIVPLEAP